MDRVLFDSQGALRHYKASYTPVRVGGDLLGCTTMWVDVTKHVHFMAELTVTASGRPGSRSGNACWSWLGRKH